MIKDYKISAVSPEQKHWDSQYGPMVTYYVKLDGEEEAVQVNKKSDSPPPKEGDELYGELTDTQYGMRFKSAKKDFAKSGGYSKSPEDKEDIARAVALKAAVEYFDKASESTGGDVFDVADMFLAWLKGEKPEAPEQPEKEKARQWDKVGQDKVHEVIEGEAIDLGDMPPEFLK